jgi:hypothetical protein
MTTALKMVFKGLQLLGIDLPENPDEQKQKFIEDIEILHNKVNKLPHVSDLGKLPDCTDIIQLNIFKLYVRRKEGQPLMQIYRLSVVWIAAYMMGMPFLAGLVCSQIVIRSIDYGVCAESGKAMVVYVLHGLVFHSDFAFLNKIAKTGLKLLDSRSVMSPSLYS